MKILLLNDTRVDPNPGCQATVTGLTRRLARRPATSLLTLPRGWGYQHFASFSTEDQRHSPAAWREAVDALHGDEEAVSAMSSADLVVANLEGTFHHHTVGALTLGGAMALAHRLRKPLWAVNGTVEAIDPWLLDETLRPAERIVVREPLSQAWLSGQGVRSVDGADCAFLLQPFSVSPPPDLPTSRRARRRALYTPGILASHTDSSRLPAEDVLRGMAALEAAGYEPQYLQMSDGEGAIAAGVRAAGWYSIDASEIAWHAFGRFLRRFDLVVSGRYHVLIFAAMAGVPFIPQRTNSWKIAGLMELLGVSGLPADGPVLSAALVDAPAGHTCSPARLAACRALAARHVPELEGTFAVEGFEFLDDRELGRALLAMPRDPDGRIETSIALAPVLAADQHVPFRSPAAWRERFAAAGFALVSERMAPEDVTPHWLDAPWRAASQAADPGNASDRWIVSLRSRSPIAPGGLPLSPPPSAAQDVMLAFVVDSSAALAAVEPIWALLDPGMFTVLFRRDDAPELSVARRWLRSLAVPSHDVDGNDIPWEALPLQRPGVLVTCDAPDRGVIVARHVAAHHHGWHSAHLAAGSGTATPVDCVIRTRSVDDAPVEPRTILEALFRCARRPSRPPSELESCVEELWRGVLKLRQRAAASGDALEALRAEHYWLQQVDAARTRAALTRSDVRLRVALFGASSLGREWAQRLSGHRRYIVDAFIDNDRTKWDTLVDGIRVRKPDTGVFGDADLIVVTSIHRAAIVAQVTGAGFGAKLVIDPAALLPPVS